MKNFPDNFEIIHISETTSTNAAAKSLSCETVNPHRFRVVWADYQTAGRGQRGNHWESAKCKNLLFTILVQPTKVKARESFILSQVVSVAVCDTLSSYGKNFSVKWPNDIYQGDRKICGVLIENKLRGEYIAQSFVGIGINVNQKKFVSDAPNPISLCQIINSEVDREFLLSKILQRFEYYFNLMEEGKSVDVKNAYLLRLFRCKRVYSYRDKKEIFRAKIQDVGPDGQLILVDTDGCTRSYAFKEIKYLLRLRECE